MQSARTILLALLVPLVAGGCVTEYTQVKAGDSCNTTSECGPGLVCLGRTCELAPGSDSPRRGRDAGFADPERDTREDVDPDRPDAVPRDVSPDTTAPTDTGPDVPPDVPPDAPLCVAGERSCLDNLRIRECNRSGTGYDVTVCDPGTVCDGDRCVPRAQCLDADGDGVPFGPGCAGTVDCNDNNPQVFPGSTEQCNGLDDDCDNQTDEGVVAICDGACNSGVRACNDGVWGACEGPAHPEVCGNGIDDNCDGLVDEGCSMCCTPDSCGPNQLCDGCNCLDAPRDECLFQNQPCDPFQTPGGEFQCVDFADGRDGLCLGLCEFNSPSPETTCPSAGSICAFEAGGGQGLCLDGCDPITQTGCFPESSCIPIGDSGGCVPAGPLNPGEICDQDEGPFGQCADGLICANLDDRGPSRCEQLCAPFSSASGDPSLCGPGTACLAAETQIGICLESLNQPEGTSCRQRDIGTPCDDGVMCLPDRNRGTECRRTCRLERGNADCLTGGQCENVRIIQQPGIGVCF